MQTPLKTLLIAKKKQAGLSNTSQTQQPGGEQSPSGDRDEQLCLLEEALKEQQRVAEAEAGEMVTQFARQCDGTC